MTRLLNTLANLFSLCVLSFSGVALFYPPLFSWFGGQMIVWSLAIIMIGMGILSGWRAPMCRWMLGVCS